MGVLIDKLEQIYQASGDPIDYVAGIRQESALDPIGVMGFADVDEMDAFIIERATARENDALLEMGTMAAPRFAYPFPPAQDPVIFPMREAAEAGAIVDSQLTTAAEAVKKFVLGDLYFKASHRDQSYALKAAMLLGDTSQGRPGEAQMTLNRALRSIQTAVAGATSSTGGKKPIGSTVMSRGDNPTVNQYRRPDPQDPVWTQLNNPDSTMRNTDPTGAPWVEEWRP